MAVLMPLWHYSLFLILWLPSGQGKIVAISNLATMGYKIYLIRKPNQRPQLVIISDICHKVVVTISDKDCMAMAVTSVKSCWIVMKRDIMAAGRAPTLARRSQERIHNHATYNQIHVSNQGAMALKNQRASERQAAPRKRPHSWADKTEKLEDTKFITYQDSSGGREKEVGALLSYGKALNFE